MLRAKYQNGTLNGSAADGVNGNGHSNGKADTVGAAKTHRSVYIVFVSLLLDLLAFTIILPLLPTILERYRVNDSSGLYNQLATQIKYFQELVGAPEKYSSVLFGGVLGSMFSFLQFVISPIMGGLSDYYGRKPIMLLSLVSLWDWSSIAICILNRFVHFFSKNRLGSRCRTWCGHFRRTFWFLCWHVSSVDWAKGTYRWVWPLSQTYRMQRIAAKPWLWLASHSPWDSLSDQWSARCSQCCPINRPACGSGIQQCLHFFSVWPISCSFCFYSKKVCQRYRSPSIAQSSTSTSKKIEWLFLQFHFAAKTSNKSNRFPATSHRSH